MSLLKNIFTLSLILILSSTWLQAQSQLSVRDKFLFSSPVRHDYKLSGNFCELRNSHFHAGLDIKQSGNGKDTIFSVGDGYISRIRVSPGGYGQAIYINHPETGLTSVYAHLEAFNREVTNYVHQHQFDQKSYDVDILLNPELFLVKQGSYIGMMGNTGHSFGKHLHLEIRETNSEKALNPFLLGFGIPDNVPPTLLKLKVHGLDEHLHKTWEKSIPLTAYSARDVDLPNVIYVPTSQAGIAINAFDRTNGSLNKQGIYSLKLFANDTLRYSVIMDNLPSDQSRYIKGFIDYKTRLLNQGSYYLCYRYPGNNLAFTQYEDNGIIHIQIDTATTLKLVLEDYAGNKRTVKIRLQGDEEIREVSSSHSDSPLITINDNTTLHIKNLSVTFNENSLFRNIYCRLDTIIRENKPTQYKIHDRYEPLKNPLKITIQPDFVIPDSMKSKAIIIREDVGRINCGGIWKDSLLETRITDFGVYSLGFDLNAPSIKAVSFLPNAAKFNKFSFRIADNFPIMSNGLTRAIQIKVWIDDVFQVCPFDAKSNTLTIPLKGIDKGKHELVIEATDHCKNTAYFNAQFIK